jgi:hypothetical protein
MGSVRSRFKKEKFALKIEFLSSYSKLLLMDYVTYQYRQFEL